MPDAPEVEKLKLIHEYGWNWFSYHAAQRMTVFRFFFLVLGALSVGYYQTIASHPGLTFAFSILAVIFSLLFWRLDLRTRELIKIGENHLAMSGSEMSKWGIMPVTLLPDANSKKTPHTTSFLPNWMYSYGQVLSAIFFLAFLFSLIAAVYAFFQIGAVQKLIHYICASS